MWTVWPWQKGCEAVMRWPLTTRPKGVYPHNIAHKSRDIAAPHHTNRRVRSRPPRSTPRFWWRTTLHAEGGGRKSMRLFTGAIQRRPLGQNGHFRKRHELSAKGCGSCAPTESSRRSSAKRMRRWTQTPPLTIISPPSPPNVHILNESAEPNTYTHAYHTEARLRRSSPYHNKACPEKPAFAMC